MPPRSVAHAKFLQKCRLFLQNDLLEQKTCKCAGFLWHLPLLSRNPKNSCTFQVFAQNPHLFIKSLHFCRLSQECRPKQRKRGALALVGDPGLVMHDRHSALTGSHCHGLAQRSSPIGDLPARFRATLPRQLQSTRAVQGNAPPIAIHPRNLGAALPATLVAPIRRRLGPVLLPTRSSPAPRLSAAP